MIVTWYDVVAMTREAAKPPPYGLIFWSVAFFADILFFIWSIRKGDSAMKVTSILIGLMLIGLAGCSTQLVQGEAKSKLAVVTMEDLDVAIASAQAENDPQAVTCYTEVKAWVNSHPSGTSVKGVFSAFEAARLVRRRVDLGIPESLHNACAPLIVDANVTLVKLGLISSGL